MKRKLASICILLPAIFAPPSCRSVQSAKALNRSALYDPPIVSLTPGVTYRFAEGDIVGTGQFFHSDYAYQQAFLLGLRGPVASKPKPPAP